MRYFNKKNKIIFLFVSLPILFILSLFDAIFISSIFIMINLALLIDIFFENKKIKIFVIMYILTNAILILINCLQAYNLGFDSGVIYGNVAGVEYYDSFKYYNYIDKLQATNIFNYINDFTSGISSDPYQYNIFILIFFVVSKIIGVNIINLLLCKLLVVILTLYFLMKLIKVYNFNTKKIIATFILFGFYPGFLIININFLRDNVILLLLVMCIYYICIYINSKNNKVLIKSICLLLVISTIRLYVSGALIFSLIIIFIINNKKDKDKIFFAIKCLISITIFIGILASIMGYGFLGYEYIKNTFDLSNLGFSLGENILRQFIGFRIVIPSLKSGILNNFLVMISPIYIASITVTLAVLIIKNKRNLDLVTFNMIIASYAFAIVIGMLLVLRDGIIVERVYAMWIWSYSVIIINLITKDVGDNEKKENINSTKFFREWWRRKGFNRYIK